MPGAKRNISIYVARMDGGEDGRQLRHELAPNDRGASPGGKRNLIRGGGSAARISNGTRPQDPGAGRCSSLPPGTRLAHSRFFDRPVFCSTGQ